MVTIEFPYPDYAPLEIEEKNLVGIFDLPESPHCASEERVIREALASPIGCPPLAEMARGKRKVLVISDDHHRPTPVRRFLPFILEAVHSAGLGKDQIEIIMALGSHRPMSPEEMEAKLGAGIASDYRVTNHDWQDQANLYFAGRVEPGIDVWINRKVKESDFVLGLGRIMPIEVCGFTGGGKIVVPGLCGARTNSDVHWVRVDIPQKEIVGRRDNPIREAIDRSALACGLDAIFNVIVDRQGRITRAVFGHPVEAHRKGAGYALKMHGVRIPGQADVVIADGYPFDVEFWQVNKALDAAGMVVRPGGVIILVSPCKEGLSPTHEDEILKYGYRPKQEIRELVERGAIKRRVVAVHMMQVAEATIEKGVTCILVSCGISKENIEKVGLRYAQDAQSALEQAFDLLGNNARVAVLRRAAEMLPILMGQN